ncbi:MAG: alpha/beta hydrolase [Gemmataceae bacterium]
MSEATSRWMLFGLAVLLFANLSDAQKSQPRRVVPPRELPVPDTLSPELQKIVAQPFPPLTAYPTTAEGWKKLQREADAGAEKAAVAAAKLLGTKVEAVEKAGVKCYRVTPKVVASGKENDLIIHVHKGAYVFNAGLAATVEAIWLAEACKTPVLSIDYRMPPDHPFPAATDDVLTVWKAVLKDHDPKKVVMGGTSAGGGLTMITILRCKAEKLAMPAALFLGTPGADWSKTGDSVYLNAEVDRVLGPYEGRAEACIKLYAAGRDLKDPLISPIYGDLSGLPPTILITGTRDLFLSATCRTHRKLRAARVPAELHVYEGMSHADYLTAANTPEGRDALGEIAAFFDRHLSRR